MTSPGRIGPWRLAFQWSAGLCVFLVPFGRVQGESLLRLDLSSRSLVLLGRFHPLEEMHLLLPLAGAAILSFLFVTMTLGRVWCGWACPQTLLADLADGLARLLAAGPHARGAPGKPWRTAVLHVGSLGLGVLVGANLVGYFLPPYELFPRVLAGALPAEAGAVLAVVAAAVYVDLVLVRRSFCRAACPYGRFQAALADSATLTLGVLPAEAHRCLQCGGCARACPMGIDIRAGQQIECLHCGRCVDACRDVMDRRGQPGLVGYTFGGGRGALRTVFHPRAALLLLAASAATGAFGVSLARWAPASLTVRRSPAPERALAARGAAVFFEATVASRSSDSQLLALGARSEGGEDLELRGAPADLTLAPRQRRLLHIALVLPEGHRPEAAHFRLLDGRGHLVAEVRAPLGRSSESRR